MSHTSHFAIAPSGVLAFLADAVLNRVPEFISRCPFRRFLVVLVMSPWVVGGLAVGDEPGEEFLTALRDVGYYDVALEYLIDMESGNLVSESFRQRIPLAKVTTLLELAGSIRDPQKIEAHLDHAERILQEFIDSKPPATLLADAQQQRSNLALGRARRLIEKSSSDRITVDQRVELQDQARQYLSTAATAFEEIRARLKSEIEAYVIDPNDSESKINLERLREQYVLVRLQSPAVKERVADSYGPDHPQYRPLLEEAVKENIELYEKYRDRPNGIEGCINAGRCYNKLGEYDKALAYLVDVFALPKGASQAIKKRKAALVAIDSWESMDPVPIEEVFTYLQPVVYALPTDFQRSSEGIRIRMAFAKACHEKSELIKKAGPSDAEERRLMVLLERESTNLMRAISRTPGPHNEEARQLLAAWGNSVLPENAADKGPPRSLMEARDRGRDLQLAVSDLKSQLLQKVTQAEQAPDADKPGIQQEIQKLQAQINTQSQTALALFELAFTFVDEGTSADDITNLRYLQCASYFQMNRFLETAIIGEFLIERYPENAGTRQAAGLVCKSLWQTYKDIEGEDKGFELQQLRKQADLILAKWPASSQAETAGLLMTLVSLAENDLGSARQYMAMIPEESPNRAQIVLEVGSRLWQDYVREDQKKTERKTDAELGGILSQAQMLLEDGVSFLKLDALTPYQARTILSLTELYLEAGEVDNALTVLESASIAPLDLIKQKHPATLEGSFKRDAYKIAIRAYLAKLRDAENSLVWVEKAQGVLDALKNEIGDTPEGQERLAAIYLTLARELNEEFQALTTNDERSEFAQGLKTFLTALQENANDQMQLLLTATMLSQVGEGLAKHGLDTEASRFFSQAARLFEQLNNQAAGAPPRTVLAIHRGRAKALCGEGKYKEAVNQFGDILEKVENQRFVDIQIEAALALQQWGLARRDTTQLSQAVMGGEKRVDPKTKRPQNVIWGWDKLAKAARGAQRHETFAEALYNLTVCKFEYGVIKGQNEMIVGALKEIEKYRENVPDMGGPEWKPKFEELERRISAGLKSNQ